MRKIIFIPFLCMMLSCSMPPDDATNKSDAEINAEVFTLSLPPLSKIHVQSDVVPVLVDSKGEQYVFPSDCPIHALDGNEVQMDYLGFNYSVSIEHGGKEGASLRSVKSIRVLQDPTTTPRLLYSTATAYRYFDDSYFIADLLPSIKWFYGYNSGQEKEGMRLLVALPTVHKDLGVLIGPRTAVDENGYPKFDPECEDVMSVDCWDGGAIIPLEETYE